jgi:osmoprotectant transport system permease protein
MEEFFQYILQNKSLILKLTWQHMEISFLAAGLAVFTGVPMGILCAKSRVLAKIILNLVSVLYTIPSLAMFGLMVPLIGMGFWPAFIALYVYSLLAIVQNTYTGINNISPDIIEAAEGMGMSNALILFKVELPLAVPVIFGGIRVAVVSAIGIATIASFIGAGGLGTLVFRGIATVSADVIMAGSIPVLIIALSLDQILKKIEIRLSQY